MKEIEDAETFDVPDGTTYGGYEVTEVGYSESFEKVWLIYEGDDLPQGWDELDFTAESEAGEVRVTRKPVGLVPPEALPADTPGAKESAEVYSILEECGITVEGYNE